jgi:uncharacterized cupin superfamily protein
VTIDDVLDADLATGHTVPTALEGEPYKRWHVPDGWSGTWKVDETVRRTYAIVKTS